MENILPTLMNEVKGQCNNNNELYYNIRQRFSMINLLPMRAGGKIGGHFLTGDLLQCIIIMQAEAVNAGFSNTDSVTAGVVIN